MYLIVTNTKLTKKKKIKTKQYQKVRKSKKKKKQTNVQKISPTPLPHPYPHRLLYLLERCEGELTLKLSRNMLKNQDIIGKKKKKISKRLLNFFRKTKQIRIITLTSIYSLCI